MSENKDDKLTGISKANSVEEIAEFWDSHSLDDYWDQTREVEFEVRNTDGARYIISHSCRLNYFKFSGDRCRKKNNE
jgi:hypothetical protein